MTKRKEIISLTLTFYKDQYERLDRVLESKNDSDCQKVSKKNLCSAATSFMLDLLEGGVLSIDISADEPCTAQHREKVLCERLYEACLSDVFVDYYNSLSADNQQHCKEHMSNAAGEYFKQKNLKQEAKND